MITFVCAFLLVAKVSASIGSTNNTTNISTHSRSDIIATTWTTQQQQQQRKFT